MRREGDRLVTHLRSATEKVVLCAPFIKASVLSELLSVVPVRVPVDVVTRWLPAEVAAGVSDLEVFDILQTRPGAGLRLLDRLHAKLYVADSSVLVGSANLTATALGWCSKPNVELLTELSLTDEAVRDCLAHLAVARTATVEERDRVREAATGMAVPPFDFAGEIDVATPSSPWLPRMGAPERLFLAYVESTRDRLPTSVLATALEDLSSLGVPAGLSKAEFSTTVTTRLASMPAVQRILAAAQDDLSDAAAIKLVGEMGNDPDLTPAVQWSIVREWLTHFLSNQYEIAPQSFVLRLRPGAKRS